MMAVDDIIHQNRIKPKKIVKINKNKQWFSFNFIFPPCIFFLILNFLRYLKQYELVFMSINNIIELIPVHIW